MRGIFYNSKHSCCSIWESGKMCYDALKQCTKYTLDYSETTVLDHSYDFAIFNQHFTVNNWMTHDIIQSYNKPTFCIVTEVAFGDNPIASSPTYFDHYIVLDSTILETDRIHAFGRPIEPFEPEPYKEHPIPHIFSFGYATTGKEWHKIVEAVQLEYDEANIHFNIPKATYVPDPMYEYEVNSLVGKCRMMIHKPGITLRITSLTLSKEELILLCSTKTLNCFFYNQENLYTSGLAAATDQAISAGRPLLVTTDRSFRHIHTYIDSYPHIGIRKAIEQNKEGVLRMKQDWSYSQFIAKFERLIEV